nr:ATP-dependent RNA helicase deah12, chloroplastic [Ipomoea batatas]
MGLDGDRGSGAGGQRRWTATLETGSSSSHLPAMASAMVSWSTTLPITLQGKQVDGEGGAGLHRWLGRRRDGGVDDGERWRSRWCLGMVASAMVTDGEAGGAWRWWRRRWCLEMIEFIASSLCRTPKPKTHRITDHQTKRSIMSVGTDSDDLQALATAQRRELMAAEAMESDFEFAFHLQLQEALNASFSLQPSTSTDPPATPPYHKPSSSAAANGESLSYTAALSQELVKFQQELDDQKLSVTEFKKIRDDLHHRIHDQKFAEEIMRIPEDEWEDWGGDFERPFGEGSSKSVNAEVFRVYF